jgi:hypothetical protein
MYTRLSLDRKPMMLGAALIGAGSLIGFSGLIVGGASLMSATRRWFLALEGPSGEMATNRLGQNTAAAMTRVSARQHSNGAQRARV